MKSKNLYLIILFSIFYFLFSYPALAATLHFQPAALKAGVGSDLVVDLLLDGTEGINAIEGDIVFPQQLLKLKEVSDGNSIVNFWIIRPDAASVDGDGWPVVNFAGIIPGGYKNLGGKVLSLRFTAIQSGEGLVMIENARALLNDGKGISATLRLLPASITVSGQRIEAGQLQLVGNQKDADSPENFDLKIGRDSSVYDGKWFVSFATQDKGSGIDHYEVLERREYRIWNSENWIAAESPYLLKDQELQSYIYVKAIDYAGNERVALLVPQQPISKYDYYAVFAIIIIGLLSYVISKIVWLRYRK